MHQLRQPVNYDLRRVGELLEQLGKPHLVARTAHIAGTKGKGSTAAMIASALAASGYKTGLYTSPHLIDLRERFRIDGRLISRVELVKLVDRLKPEVTAVNEKASYGRLTTFELLTALAFLYFAQEGVDFQVVEAGLGGRLDATNVVRPEVCVITSINLDHTDVLGDSLAKIAAEIKRKEAGQAELKKEITRLKREKKSADILLEEKRQVRGPAEELLAPDLLNDL